MESQSKEQQKLKYYRIVHQKFGDYVETPDGNFMFLKDVEPHLQQFCLAVAFNEDEAKHMLAVSINKAHRKDGDFIGKLSIEMYLIH